MMDELPNDILSIFSSHLQPVDLNLTSIFSFRGINKCCNLIINEQLKQYFDKVVSPYYDAMRIKFAPSLNLRMTFKYIKGREASFYPSCIGIYGIPGQGLNGKTHVLKNTTIQLKQCEAFNKKNKVCKRSCTRKYCWQHNKLLNVITF